MVLAFVSMTLSKAYNGLFYPTMIGPAWRGAAYPTAEVKAKLDEEFKSQLGNLTKYLVHFGGDYLTGQNYTPADSAAFAYINQVIDNNHYSLEEHPELKAWYD